MEIIDAYTHIYPKPYLSKLESLADEEAKTAAGRWSARARTNPHYIDVEARLIDLDKYGIDKEITAVSQDVVSKQVCLDRK